MSIEAMKQALEALEEIMSWEENAEMTWAEKATQSITSLRQAIAKPNRAEKMRAAGYTRRPTLRELAEPQTTHWEGCEAVHPECRKPEQAEKQGPLTDEEINEIYMANCYSDTLTFVRAIERAHGIRDKT